MNKTTAFKAISENFKKANDFLDSDFGFRMWNRLYAGEGVVVELVEFKNAMMNVNQVIRAISYYLELGGRRDVSRWIEKTHNLIERTEKLHRAFLKYISEK